ncbi:cobalt-precorrin-7 (C(5))-methyltransferase [Neisseria sp. Ec49-e6-T10]|uniref:cobalt-precorrin-7 (C(5))-methyltransferase n=1 Tax=Neisseria sp. Ec49-e6-T10 TaxID=3140744 RepID=UPI003EBEEF9F
MISIVGLGPGQADYLTPLASKLIQDSDWLVGAERQIKAIGAYSGQIHLLDKKLMDLVTWLQAHQTEHVVVLASGDPMLYGIGKFLSHQLGRHNIQIVSGISAIQYLFARVGLDMNDVYLTSSHGKQPDFDFVLQHEKAALVTDQIIGPYEIAQEVLKRGLERTIIIGENLSYENEHIQVLNAQDVPKQIYQLNVVIIVNER